MCIIPIYILFSFFSVLFFNLNASPMLYGQGEGRIGRGLKRGRG
jgi:hypothetical protein